MTHKFSFIFIILMSTMCAACSGSILVSVEEYEPKTLVDYQPNEIFITDKDSIKYHFSNDTYCYIHNNVLNVKGYSSLYDSSQGSKVETQTIKKIEGIIPLEQIKTIEEIGENKIKVITSASEEYLFENRSYYYIENDTLFGLGEIYSEVGVDYFEGRIAIGNITNVMSGLEYLGRKEAKWTELIPIEEDEVKYSDYREAGEGAEVTVLLKADILASGELLSVRDSSLLISLDYSDMRDMGYFVSPIIEIKNEDIEKIVIEGEDNFWKGAGYGAIIGVVIGGIWGYAEANNQEGIIIFTTAQTALGGAACIGFLGAMIGGIAGGASSYDEVVISLPSDYDFSILNKYLGTSLNSLLNQLSRYPEMEPENLQEYQ